MEVARPQVGGQRDDEGRDEPGACEPAAGRQALTGCLWVLPDECGAGLLVAADGPHGLRGSQAVILLLCDSRDHWRISTFRAATESSCCLNLRPPECNREAMDDDAGRIVFHGTSADLTARGDGTGAAGDAPLECGYSAVLATARSAMAARP